MNKRLYNILFQICENPYSISIKSLAENLNVSEKVLYSDITRLNEILSSKNLGKIKIKDGYISYYGDISTLKEYLDNLSFYEYVLTKDERIIVEVLLLLFVQDKIILADMADIMHVSRSTVIGDRDSLEKYIEINDLVLHSKSSYGLEIKGLESNIRKLYIKLLFQEENLVKMLLNQKLPMNIIGNDFKVIESNDSLIQNIIVETETLSNLTLTGNSNWVLKEYLKFSIYRMQKDLYIENYLPLNNGNPYGSVFIDNLYPMILDNFQIRECQLEKDLLKYLAQYFRYTSDTLEVFIENILETQTIVRKFIDKVSIDLNLPIYRDYELFENLSLHLDRIFGRKKMKSILYPEVEKVVKDNLHVKAVVDKHISILEEHFHIKMTDGDIAYIIIYICASIEKLKQQAFDVNVVIVCNSGFGTSQLLKYRLEEHFTFNIKKILPAHNLEKNSDLLEEIDFIISTVYLDINFPYVRISPLLTEVDIYNIITMLLQLETADMKLNSQNQNNQKILLNKIKSICQPYNNLYENIVPAIEDYFNQEKDFIYLHSLLTEDFIQVDVEAYNWEDSIRKAAKILLDKSFITENYIDAMIDNYKKNGPYFVIAPNFAMPHASIEAGARKLGMSLIRLKDPVNFGIKELDPIKYICVISAIDNNMHLKAMFNLINLLKIEEFKNALDSANNSREIAKVIAEFEQNII